MRLREPFVRKHVCIFTVCRADWQSSTSIAVERKCDECGKVQSAYVNPKEWPESLWALADVPWVDKKLYDFLS